MGDEPLLQAIPKVLDTQRFNDHHQFQVLPGQDPMELAGHQDYLRTYVYTKEGKPKCERNRKRL